MKEILKFLIPILLIGCAQNHNSRNSFDNTLLEHEDIDQNIPLKVEPYAAPEVVKNLAPIRAQFDNLAITEESETINPRMTSFAKQMAKTIYEPVKDKVFLMAGWQLTSTLIVVGEDGLQPGIDNPVTLGGDRRLRSFQQHGRADVAKNEMGVTVAEVQVTAADLRVEHQDAVGTAGKNCVPPLLDAESRG